MARRRDPDDCEFAPMLIDPLGPVGFPDPRVADADGLVAVGGDLSVERLLFAYSHAIFPWFDDRHPPLWWSPDPRCLIPLADFHVPSRLARRMRRADYEVTMSLAFEAVMRGCAEAREDGTWVTETMIEAYCRLHAAGHATSFEVWQQGDLVGGLYGVSIGGLFAAESMFRRRDDMSKIALVCALRTLDRAGVELFDVQFRTAHLTRFGCVELPRSEYYERVQAATVVDVELPSPGPVAIA